MTNDNDRSLVISHWSLVSPSSLTPVLGSSLIADARSIPGVAYAHSPFLPQAILAVRGRTWHSPVTVRIGRNETARVYTRTRIEGKPRDRGRQYGKHFHDGIRVFLDKEILRPFVGKPSTKDDMLRYAGACGQEVQEVHARSFTTSWRASPKDPALRLEETGPHHLARGVVSQGGAAEGPALHRGRRRPAGHGRRAASSARPGTGWRPSSACPACWTGSGPEGPSLLAYAFPGLWAGAGLNSAGLALCWTSAALGEKGQGARVGIPSLRPADAPALPGNARSGRGRSEAGHERGLVHVRHGRREGEPPQHRGVAEGGRDRTDEGPALPRRLRVTEDDRHAGGPAGQAACALREGQRADRPGHGQGRSRKHAGLVRGSEGRASRSASRPST